MIAPRRERRPPRRTPGADRGTETVGRTGSAGPTHANPPVSGSRFTPLNMEEEPNAIPECETPANIPLRKDKQIANSGSREIRPTTKSRRANV